MKLLYVFALIVCLLGMVGCNKPLPAKHYVVYDFGASWCVPCKVLQPRFDTWKERYSNANVVFKSVNVDPDNTMQKTLIWDEFKLVAVPTIVVVCEGQEIWRFEGCPTDEVHFLDLEKQIADRLK